MPYDVFTKLYDSFVAPIIEHPTAIWSHKEISCINDVKTRFYLRVSKFK